MGKITRRLLLGSVGVLALGGASYGASRVACRFVPRNHPDFFSLLDLVPDDAAAGRVGAEALMLAETPGDLPGLIEALSQRPLIRTALATECPTTRRALVQDQCAADFAERRTVMVDGWVLSETEANLCAARRLSPRIT